MKAGISCTSFILHKLSRSFRKTEITNIENRGIKLFCCGGCLVTKSCLTLCDPMDCSPPGSSVHGISQARILEQVAISFSRGSSWPRDWTHVFCIGRQILYHWATRGPLELWRPGAATRQSMHNNKESVWCYGDPVCPEWAQRSQITCNTWTNNILRIPKSV